MAARDLRALRRLEDAGIVRVIASGRSLFSARKVLDAAFPIDYLVFSSGAGVLEWKSQRLMHQECFLRGDLIEIVRFLEAQGVNYMIHDPVPENQRFRYRRHHREDTDFEVRLNMYRPFARALNSAGGLTDEGASQVLIIIPMERQDLLAAISTALDRFCHVIRTTSPLDGRSLWVELFPRGVSKASGILFICEKLGIPRGMILALGNDYNDLDMLRIAGNSWVVPGAPQPLKEKYPSCVDAGKGILSELMKMVETPVTAG